MRRGGGWRAWAMAVMVPILGACAAGEPLEARQEIVPQTPIVLRSVPRHVQFAPVNEWVYLWDRPGGLSARALRVAQVPSGTAGLLLAVDPPDPPMSDFWAAIGADTVERQPVRWVRVTTPGGEGWVRREFVEPR